MENRIFNHLPIEIIDEILHKLPVKSVLRLKCVSKSWRSSVSSGTTSTNSMRLQISPIITLIFRFDGVSPGSDSLPKRVGSCCIGSDPLGSNQSIPVPALEDNGTIFLLGSYNGLILLRNCIYGTLQLEKPRILWKPHFFNKQVLGRGDGIVWGAG